MDPYVFSSTPRLRHFAMCRTDLAVLPRDREAFEKAIEIGIAMRKHVLGVARSGLDHIVQMGGGYFGMCALRVDSSSANRDVYCWGSNQFGQLGHDPATDPPCSFTHCNVVALIVRIAKDNPRWSRRRIAHELAMLGYRVDKNTVAEYMPKPADRPRRPRSLSPRGSIQFTPEFSAERENCR